MHPPIQFNPLRAALCAWLALLTPVAALAQPEEKWALSIGAATQHFAYREFSDSGTLFNQEDGAIPGVALSLGRSHDRWRFVGDFSYHAGDVAYVGQTNTGLPISTRTKQNMVDLSLRAEFWQATTGGLDYALYFGTGFHHRERDIQPTRTADGRPVSGLFETYQWWFGLLGAKAVLHASPRVRWLLDARLTRPLNPSVTVDFGGRFDETRLSLGEHWGARLALPWHYTLSRATDFTVEPFAESHALGRSATMPLTRNGLPAGAVYQPRSENRNYGLVIGISQRF